MRVDYHHKLKKPIKSRASRVYYLAGKIKWRRRALISLAILILLGSFYFLFYSDFFMIQEIKIIDNFESHKIPPTLSDRSRQTLYRSDKTSDILRMTRVNLNQKRFYIFSQKNFFLFDKNQLKEIILAKYNFEELIISEKFPNKLKIKIKEKLPFLILDLRSFASFKTNLWFIDQEGQILEETTEEEVEKNQLPLVSTGFSLTSLANPEIFIKQKIFTKEKTLFIKEIFLGLLSSQIERGIPYFIIPSQKESKVIVKTSEGWEIYFDSLGNPKTQLQNLELILKEKIKENRKNLRYIDLRFGERVYYH